MSQTTIKIWFAAELLPDLQYTDGYTLLLYTEDEECCADDRTWRGRGYWCGSISHHHQQRVEHRQQQPQFLRFYLYLVSSMYPTTLHAKSSTAFTYTTTNILSIYIYVNNIFQRKICCLQFLIYFYIHIWRNTTSIFGRPQLVGAALDIYCGRVTCSAYLI